jgi:hypothetical protein
MFPSMTDPLADDAPPPEEIEMALEDLTGQDTPPASLTPTRWTN